MGVFQFLSYGQNDRGIFLRLPGGVTRSSLFQGVQTNCWSPSSLLFNKFVSFWRQSPTRARASSFSMFYDHTKWHTTVGRTPLNEGSALHRNLYLTPHNTHKIHTSMPPLGIFCSLSVFYPCLFVLTVLAFALVYNTHNTNIHAPGGIRTRNPSKQEAAELRLRPLGHWDRPDSNPQSQQASDRRPSP